MPIKIYRQVKFTDGRPFLTVVGNPTANNYLKPPFKDQKLLSVYFFTLPVYRVFLVA